MIPIAGCDPDINVISIGAKILKKMMDGSQTLDAIFNEYPNELKVSTDHIILTLDWLFSIRAIDFNGVEVFIDEA